MLTGGEFAYDTSHETCSAGPIASEKQDKGWSTPRLDYGGGDVIEVHAECLKVVNE